MKHTTGFKIAIGLWVLILIGGSIAAKYLSTPPSVSEIQKPHGSPAGGCPLDCATGTGSVIFSGPCQIEDPCWSDWLLHFPKPPTKKHTTHKVYKTLGLVGGGTISVTITDPDPPKRVGDPALVCRYTLSNGSFEDDKCPADWHTLQEVSPELISPEMQEAP